MTEADDKSKVSSRLYGAAFGLGFGLFIGWIVSLSTGVSLVACLWACGGLGFIVTLVFGLEGILALLSPWGL